MGRRYAAVHGIADEEYGMSEKVKRHIAAAEDAANILLELIHTGDMTALHFEFNMSIDTPGTVSYTIDRFVGVRRGDS